jgi:hypothetical protein
MKWTYIIKNKLLASASLLSLCFLVLFSNYIDRAYTENVKQSISTLYEDRLIAEDYILKMTSRLYQLKGMLNTDKSDVNKGNTIEGLLIGIREANNSYNETKFTVSEKIKAEELQIVLHKVEHSQLNNTQVNIELLDKALNILNDLSAIQLAESKQIMNYAERLYLSGKTSSQFVFALIIIILLVLQALVFTSKTILTKTNSAYPNLN